MIIGIEGHHHICSIEQWTQRKSELTKVIVIIVDIVIVKSSLAYYLEVVYSLGERRQIWIIQKYPLYQLIKAFTRICHQFNIGTYNMLAVYIFTQFLFLLVYPNRDSWRNETRHSNEYTYNTTIFIHCCLCIHPWSRTNLIKFALRVIVSECVQSPLLF